LYLISWVAVADRLNLEFTVGLEGPHSVSLDRSRLLFVAVERFPIHLGVAIRAPDGEKHGVLLVVIHQRLRR
jgi:hypothetical protein